MKKSINEDEIIMIKIKKFFSLLITMLLVCGITITISSAQRKTYPQVNYWSSNINRVFYTPYNGSYYIFDYCTNNMVRNYFLDGIASARDQWNAVLPVGIKETSYNRALNYIYGGTYAKLADIFPDLTPDLAGITTLSPNFSETEYVEYIDGELMDVNTLSVPGKMCVVEKSNILKSGYINTALHEMGHLFGWDGHSPKSNQVMYRDRNYITELTPSDKNHLKQIYDIFY